MALLVDECVWPWRDRRWCHLVSDSTLPELHGFAERLGLPRRAFQGDHYDLDETLRAEAIALGADAVSGRDLVNRLIESGLRLLPLERRAAAAVAGVGAVLAVRPADHRRDADLVARHLAEVPGGQAVWWTGWGRAGDVAVVADDGNRVGVALCRSLPDDPAAAALAVAVARPCRGRGIGSSLVSGLAAEAATAGHSVLRITVRPGTPALERLAHTTGFHPTTHPDVFERRL